MVTLMKTPFSRSRSAAALAVALLVVPAVLGGATRGPDPAGYTATDATVYSFVDISGGGAGVLADTDDGTAALTLPFPFTFYGAPRTLLCVSSNGAAYFVPDLATCSGIVDFANTDLSVTNPPADVPTLLPFWSDLTFDQAGAGSVLYQTIGTAGSRQFVVQWQNAYPSGSSTPVTFQMILREGTGQVLFQYKSVDLGAGNPATRGAGATVGIRNAGALVSGEQIQWSVGVSVIANDTAVLFDRPATTSRMFGAGFVRLDDDERLSFALDVRGPEPPSGTLSLVRERLRPCGGGDRDDDRDDRDRDDRDDRDRERDDDGRGERWPHENRRDDRDRDDDRHDGRDKPCYRARMTFASTSVTEVTLEGGKMRIHGLGTIDGRSGFRFHATAIDGSPDRFGVVIRRVSNNRVVFEADVKRVRGGSLTLQ